MAVSCEERDGFLGCHILHLNLVKTGLRVDVLACGIANEMWTFWVCLGGVAHDFGKT